MLFCLGMARAEIVELGASGGTETTGNRLPTDIYYSYAMTQQIYTPYEIDCIDGFVGTIRGVGFYSSDETDRTIDLYLVATDKSHFSGSNDWIPFTEADKMFSGKVSFASGEWTKITFQDGKRFRRSASDNLAVIVVDRTGGYDNRTVTFKAYTADSQALCAHNDITQYDAGGLSGYNGTVMDVKNQIRLTGLEDSFTVGPSRTDELPTDGFGYSVSEQIYTKEEIGKSGTIRSLAFYSKTASCTRNIDLWLGTTAKQSFQSDTDWLKPSQAGAVKVFSGNVTFTAGEWTTITFATPFSYEGTGNLLVITDDNTGSSAGEQFFYTYEGQGQALCASSSDSNIDPADVNEWIYLKDIKNRIRLDIVEGGSGGDTGTFLVGDGSDTGSSGLPSAVNWKYCVSQQIYTVGEINHSGSITAIAFKPVKGPAQTRTFDLYLTTTDKTSFTGTADWIYFDDSQKVFSGDVALSNGEWATITLDEPFYYQGTQSLCLSVIDRTGSFITGTSIDWLVYNAEKQSLLKYNDNSAYDPGTMDFSMTGNFKTYKDQLQLTFKGTTVVPDAEPEIVEIGSDVYQENDLPVYTLSKYGMTEQIYTKEEIGKSGFITSLAFSGASDTMDGNVRKLDIYLVQTDKAGFTADGDVISASAGDKVFSGIVAFHLGWNTIDLDAPFHYDGKSNLAVIVDDNTGSASWRYECQFDVFGSTTKCTAYIHSNDTNYDPANASSYSFSRVSYKNCIQLGIVADSGSGADTEVVQIGNGENGDYYLPVNTYYNYSLTQQIYTASEIGTAGTISSVAFDYAYTQSLSMSGVQMYMKNVSKDVFTGDRDMVAVGAGDKVWEGTLSATEPGWVTIDLDTPFKYDGKSNLLVCLYDPTSGYLGAAYSFRNTVLDDYRTLTYWSDSHVPDLDNISSFEGSAGLKKYRSNIKLNIIKGGSDPVLDSDVIDFETGDLSQFSFQNSSEHPWTVTSEDAAGGTYCMKSGNAGIASSNSAITATRTYGADGYICFDAKCMGEGSGSGWDKCIFSIDDEVQFSYGARGNAWSSYFFHVTAGTHTFKWEYAKDSSVNADGDAFFVDNIMFLEEGKDDDIIVGVSPLGETEEGAAVYNLAGQRLSKMQRGINIVKEKKVLY